MATQITLTQTKAVRAEARLVIDAGETEVLFALPEAVPDGQKLVLQVTVAGTFVDADKAPAESSVAVGTVTTPVKPG